MKLLLKLLLILQLIPTSFIHAHRSWWANTSDSDKCCIVTPFVIGATLLGGGITLVVNDYPIGVASIAVGGIITGIYTLIGTCGVLEHTCNRWDRYNQAHRPRELPMRVVRIDHIEAVEHGTNREQQDINYHPNVIRTEIANTTLDDIQRMEQGRASSSQGPDRIASSVQQPIQPLPVRALNYLDSTCAICHETMGLDKNGGIANPPFECQHTTCVNCVQGWLDTKGTQAECPLCRARLRKP